MRPTQRKALAVGIAAALTLVLAQTSTALAQLTGLHGMEVRDAVTSPPRTSDLRSPDARDAGERRQTAPAGPPTRPLNPQPIIRLRPPAEARPSGLDWISAGIGAAAVLGAFAVTAAGVVGRRRWGATRPGSLTAR